MEIESLPVTSRECIARVVQLVRDALARNSTVHLKAVSHSWLVAGSTIHEALGGGQLVAPSKPPFDYDKRELLEAHRAALVTSSTSDVPLHNLIARASRNTPNSTWEVRLRLVSCAEYA